jgi:uncharacterized cupin superfamily protein
VSEKHELVVRRDDLPEEAQVSYSHPLNPSAEVHMKPLSRIVGLKRTGLSEVRVPPGKESFVYHSHRHEEEWIYVLSGRGVAEIGDDQVELGPGDFVGFPTPSVGHHLRNASGEELVYLMGGENREVEIAEFPRHGKRLIRDGAEMRVVEVDALRPFGPGS